MIIGLISDTHNLMRPQALDALNGVEQILHAGDVCSQEILDALATIAPVTAIRGNCDAPPWASALPATAMVELGGIWIYMLHDLRGLEIDPARAGVRVVLSGHTHRACSEEKSGVLYINPGSAGPRRFSLPVSVARLTVEGGAVELKMVTIC